MKAMPKVKSFLDGVSRNSNNTKRTYETGITYFYAFLKEKTLFIHLRLSCSL
jgi:hypothetical protein